MSIVRLGPLEPRDLEPLIATSRALIANGKDLEEVWAFLRAEGCHMGDCIDVTMALTGMRHRDAKSAVFGSQAWGDFSPAVEGLHDSIERAVIQLAEEEPDRITYRSESPAKSAR